MSRISSIASLLRFSPLILALALPLYRAPPAAAACPPVTVSNPHGVPQGQYRQQYELKAFERLARCRLSFRANPDIERLNRQIHGNPPLPSLRNRLPEEPLVVAPYDAIGRYGGVMNVLSNANEAGTSDFLSTRHVNLVRYADDLQTIVPNVAKSWTWNDDYTELTFRLRKGHKWSDGAPFTSADVKFWYDNLALDPNVFAKPRDYVLVAGERMQVETPDAQTVVFKLPNPKPGLLAHFATHYGQGFQPKHFLGRFHPDLNVNADAYARRLGFENGYAAIQAYYGNSDWTDTGSPMLNSPDKLGALDAHAVPTLESHFVIRETTEGRHYVANPYFFMVDTQGNQLPYISEQDELFVNDHQVRLLKLINGEVDYKAQSLQIADAPLLLENQRKGDYTIQLKPKIAMHAFSFNVTSNDPLKRKIFGDFDFRYAMSIAIDREEINETAYFGLGEIQQYVGFSPTPAFVDEKWKTFAVEYNPRQARRMLDAIGLIDRDGDGFRDLEDGRPLILNLQFSTQGIAGQVVELVGKHWSDVGVKTTVKEVTPDEYRSAQSSNQLDVGLWEKSQPIAIILGNNELWTPPFENYFAHRTGMLWAEWVDSRGSQGIEPPDYVKELIANIDSFQSLTPGSPQSDRVGAELVADMTGNLLFIGTALTPDPIYHRNALKNVPEFKTASYEYYRTFPYRAHQWFLDE